MRGVLLGLALASSGCEIVFPLEGKAPFDAAIDSTNSLCPDNYDSHPNGRYRFEASKEMGFIAAARCRDEKVLGSSLFTHLVVLTDDAERDIVNIVASGEVQVWIGLTDENHEGDFRWITGEDALMSPHYPGDHFSPPWKSTEPSNTNGRENCTVLQNDGQLNDLPCMDPPFVSSYVCECDDHEELTNP